MFYYAEINNDYLVINTHSLTEASTNANYITITEEQYTDGDLIDKYYNSLTGDFEIMADGDATAPSDWITYGETSMILTTKIDNMQVEINNLANSNSGGVSQDDLQVLENMISTKADVNHSHTEYALVDHIHDDYATQVALDTLGAEVDEKADVSHAHSEYAPLTHSHDDYSPLVHSHTEYVTQTSLDGAIETLESEIDGKADASHAHSEYASSTHLHNEYADANHNHDSNYAPLSHSHDNYVTTTTFDALAVEVDGKAEIGHSHSNYSETTHNHDEDYSPLSHSHTASEIGAAVSGHNHDSVYDASGSAASALNSANAYTDSKIDALVGEGASTTLDTISEISSAIEDNQDAIDLLNSAIANKANAIDLTSHASDTELHITEAERNNWNAKSDFSGNYNDLTNKPSIPSISGLASEDYVDEKVGAVTVESIGALPDTTVIPTVPTNVSAFANDAGYLTEHQSLDGLATESYVNTQIDAIDIPSALSDLTADSTHRVVTDAEKAAWNAKSNFSGSYNDLTNKPSIPSISGLATETYVDEAVNSKANSNHNHDSSYDALGTAEAKANEVQANLDVASEELSEHINNSNIHFTATERTKLSGIASNANNYTHPNSGVTAGTYKSVTVNAQGHITAGANPTTLAGYGITDAESKGAANNALASAKEYTDTAIDTLGETVATKAKASDLTSHTGNTTAHITSTERANWNNAKTHADSAHAPSNAEPNQNAFSNVVVGSTTISADTKTDTLTLVAGNNVTITPDSTGDSITISSANTVYTHPTSAGNKHIPAGGSSGQILRWSADGTAVWGNDNNTTYSNATQSASGLMSNTDKTKLDGIAENANNYTLPSAGTSLGGVKTGGDVTISGGVITVNDDSHNHVISNVDGLQSALDSKAASGHNHDSVYYTETETDALLEGKANTSHTHTISNITNLQTTLDGKANTSHGTHVSYSTTAPVMDGTASVGTSSTVARSDHKHPTDTSRAAQTSLDSHTSNKSNPHGVTLAQLGVTATAAELNKMDGVTATTAELNYVDGVTSNIQTQLNSKASSSHTHSAATTSAAGLMSADDKAKLDGIASGANKYTLPTASSTLGGVKTTSTVTSNSGYTACPIIGGVPYYKDTNTTYNLGSFGVTATAAELNYVDGVTSNVQTQLNGKAASSHTHNYAGSSSAGGAATSANKLATARTISLTGDVSGSTSFDGSGNVSITTTVADDSHNHTIANVDGLQSALDVKSDNDHRHYAINIAVTGQDLNNYTDAGFYTFANAYAPTNAPSGNTNGWLLVIPWQQGNATIKQIWFRHGTVNSNDFETYVRTKIGTYGWSDWSKYYTSSNPPTPAEIGAATAFTSASGGVKLGFNVSDNKNLINEIGALATGVYTIYSQSGVSGNPKTTEAWRMLVHKTSATIGWVMAFGSSGSVYANYQNEADHFQGWRCIYDATNSNILWTGAYYMHSPSSTPQVVTPSKKLSECRTGWLLLWSDYDASTGTTNDSDFCTTYIPKYNPSGGTWGGKAFYCDIPMYIGSDVTNITTEQRIIKPIYVHDDCIKGSYQNNQGGRNDVVLRAVYEV